ncbi:MAG: NosD domain-containing protein [Candidatus Thorarchaeota archaeon]
MNQRVLAAILFSLVLVLGVQNVSSFPDQIVEDSLLEDAIPIIDSPLDIVYSYGDTGNTITWEIADDDPSHWFVLKDGELVSESSWHDNNETVVVNVDGLDPGIFQYMILASDSAHNSTDEVIVSVLSVAYATHIPFSINSDAIFHTTASSEGWKGHGNETHPYVIENLYIQAGYNCISISYTTLHFVIRNCTFVKTGVDSGIGITLQNVRNGTIENCTFLNLWVGCIAWYTLDCEWESNIFGNVCDGIMIYEGEDCDILHNTFYSGGLYLSGYSVENWVHDVIGNTVGGKTLGYFNGLNGDIIDASTYGQVILANCSDVSVRYGMFENVGTGISVGHSVGSVVEDSLVIGSRIGVFVERSDETTIYDIQVLGASEIGIQLNESIRCVLDTCVVTDSKWDGVVVLMAHNATIVNNAISGAGDYGLALMESSFSYVHNNTFDHNQWGLGIGGCTDTDVIDNRVRWNSEKGIQVWWGENCVFYDNEIGFNGVENAYDDGTNNSWDDSESKGNMWSDYTGSGYYYIPGAAGSIDHYPELIPDDTLPIVSDTEDFDYIVGTTEHVIEWIAVSSHPLSYQIYKDGVLDASDIWDSELIIVEIGDLSVGTYNFTLVVYDTNMKTASDTVIVTVRPDSTTSSTTTTTTNTNTNITGNPELQQQVTLMISIGSTVVIVVVGVMACRSRKGAV